MIGLFQAKRKKIINQGQIVEAFVGQELLVYSSPFTRIELYYWNREVRGSSAKIDYLCQKDGQIIPIEVKSGKQGKLKSMRLFLEQHPQSSYGIKVDIHNHSQFKNIRTLSLYSPRLLSHSNCHLNYLTKEEN